MYSLLVPVLAATEGGVGASDIQPIITAITSQITLGNIISILAAGITAVIGIVFGWWGARKLSAMLMRAFKRGKLRL